MFPHGVEDTNGLGKTLSNLVVRLVDRTYLVSKSETKGIFGFLAEEE